MQFVKVAPGKIAARDNACANSIEVAGRNVVKEVERWLRALVGLAFHQHLVPVGIVVVHRHGCGKANRGDAGDRAQLVSNRALHVRHRHCIRNQRARDEDLHRFNMLRVGEAGLNAAQLRKGANH